MARSRTAGETKGRGAMPYPTPSIKHTPAALGYQMPPEWAPQEAIWLTWPSNPATWIGSREELIPAYAALIQLCARFEPVRLIVPPGVEAAIRAHLERADLRQILPRQQDQDSLTRRKEILPVPSFPIDLIPLPTNDAWCRDHGPTFLRHPEKGLAIVDWPYNAWGGKFPPWEDDEAVPAALEALIPERFGVELPRFRAPLICEGGAIEVNGAGLALTTESVLLNPNRNPQASRPEVEAMLRNYLGVKGVAWLRGGMESDDTDGHIDTLARFFSADGIVYNGVPSGPHEDARILAENRERLEGLRTPSGARFDLAALPLPPRPRSSEGDCLPATYANYLILNETVLVPAYGETRPDEHARGLIGELFPGREAISVDCRLFLQEGGALHCLSQQQPALV